MYIQFTSCVYGVELILIIVWYSDVKIFHQKIFRRSHRRYSVKEISTQVFWRTSANGCFWILLMTHFMSLVSFRGKRNKALTRNGLITTVRSMMCFHLWVNVTLLSNRNQSIICSGIRLPGFFMIASLVFIINFTSEDTNPLQSVMQINWIYFIGGHCIHLNTTIDQGRNYIRIV